MSKYIVKVQKNNEGFSVDEYPIDEGRVPAVETSFGELWITHTSEADQNGEEDETTAETLVATYAQGSWHRIWIESDTNAEPS